MYKTFKIDKEEIEKLNQIRQCEFDCSYDNLYSTITNNVFKEKNIIESFKNPIIDGSQIQTQCFPIKELGYFNVFISHSHLDIVTVKKFATWLQEKLRLRCFVDSLYWENAKNLLKNGYRGKKLSSEDVHAILSMALMKMMNLTECVIFVESKESYFNGATLSPWIYEELCFMNMLQRNIPNRINNISEEKVKTFSENKVSFDVNIDRHEIMNSKVLNDALRKGKQSVFALNYIYDNNGY